MTPTTMTAEEWRKKQPREATATLNTVDGSIVVTIGIPHSSLSPNSRSHWSKKANESKRLRSSVSKAFDRWHRPRWKFATLQAIFFWPDRRHRDDDNAMASLKSARDGLADAGIVINDRVFITLPAAMWYDKENPRVEIVVKEVKA